MAVRFPLRLIASSLLAFIVIRPSPALAQSDFTVVYTGKLLGYARIPDLQTYEARGCHLPADVPAGGPDWVGARLLDQLKQEKGALRVGMGDNFAPELDARRFAPSKDAVGAAKTGAGRFKDRYTWDSRPDKLEWVKNAPDQQEQRSPLSDLDPLLHAGHSTVPTDNVACFFKLAGYTALVPGKHDFYYGSERLRAIARFLATPDGPGSTGVQMLAANLVIVTEDTKAAPRLPDKKRMTGRQWLSSYGQTKIDLPGTVLPWMREFSVRNAGELATVAAGRTTLVAFDTVRPEDILVTNSDFRYTSAAATRPFVGTAYAVTSRIKSAKLCKGSDNDTSGTTNDPDDFFAPDDREKCRSLEELPQPLNKKLTLNTVFRLPKAAAALHPDTNYGLCLELPVEEEGKKYYCAPFTVRAPFFEYGHAAKDLPAPPPAPAPYVSTRAGGQSVVVFGVVDPELPEHIGRLNYSWVNAKHRYDSAIRTIDPKLALQQQMQTCWADADCRAARKVLLAQMPQFKAAELAGRLTRNWFNQGRATSEQGNDAFDVIISQAEEGHATGNETRDKTWPASASTTLPNVSQPWNWFEATDQPRSPFLVTPDPLRDESGSDGCPAPADPNGGSRCVRVTVQRALIRKVSDEHWTLFHKSKSAMGRLTVDAVDGPTLLDAADAALKKLAPRYPGKTPVGAAETLQQLALQVMRRERSSGFNADIALIQQRDLFRPDWYGAQRVNGDTLQATLDRVFWKGDYALKVYATGATIKEMLKKSAVYQANDNSSLSTEVETGRALVVLGALLRPDDQVYLIKGQPIDDTTMYGVAASDYVGLGDTGYPELIAKPPVPLDRTSDLRKVSPIASLLCAEISRAAATGTSLATAKCERTPLDARAELDGTDQRPADTTPGLTPYRKLRDWFGFPGFDRSIAGANPFEHVVQSQPAWTVTLTSAELGLNLNTHSLPASRAGDEFAGVSNARVTGSNSRSLNFGYDARATARLQRPFDVFASSKLNVVLENTQQKDDTFLRNQKSNEVNVESGFLWHVVPRGKQVNGITALTSVRVESQPLQPVNTVSDFHVPVQRRTLLTGKLGARFDGNRRWFEAGWQTGWLFNSVYAYAYPGGSCTAAVADADLKACVTGAGITSEAELTPLDRQRPQQGWFLNARAEIPMAWLQKGALVLENRAEFFNKTGADTPVDTRAYDNFIASILVNLYGNLSLTPKFDWYYFQNKVEHDTITNTQFSVNLNYHFDWHAGLRLWRAMRYANPAAGK